MRRNGFVTFFVALGTPSSLEHNSAAAQKAERIPSNTNFGMALLVKKGNEEPSRGGL